MKKKPIPLLSFLGRPIPSFIVLILVSIAGFTGYIVQPPPPPQKAAECLTRMEQIREQDRKFTRRLLLADVPRENDHFAILKTTLSLLVNRARIEGRARSISIYFRMMNDGAWIALNEQERFSPGSLLKVQLLIAWLKQVEKNPDALQQKIRFDKHHEVERTPIFTGPSLETGRMYTIRDLLRHMIVYSDNDATILLNSYLDASIDRKVYEDLGLRAPNPNERDYPLTVQECSRFFRVLFNATYVDPDLSEYALRLLSSVAFDGGIAPPLGDIPVARKFGERGSGGEKEYHEIGIVYLENQPYLLGVMTRGDSYDDLIQVVHDISQTIYESLLNAPPV